MVSYACLHQSLIKSIWFDHDNSQVVPLSTSIHLGSLRQFLKTNDTIGVCTRPQSGKFTPLSERCLFWRKSKWSPRCTWRDRTKGLVTVPGLQLPQLKGPPWLRLTDIEAAQSLSQAHASKAYYGHASLIKAAHTLFAANPMSMHLRVFWPKTQFF